MKIVGKLLISLGTFQNHWCSKIGCVKSKKEVDSGSIILLVSKSPMFIALIPGSDCVSPDILGCCAMLPEKMDAAELWIPDTAWHSDTAVTARLMIDAKTLRTPGNYRWKHQIELSLTIIILDGFSYTIETTHQKHGNNEITTGKFGQTGRFPNSGQTPCSGPNLGLLFSH